MTHAGKYALLAAMLAFTVSSKTQAQAETSATSQPQFITAVLADKTIKLYDVDFNLLEEMSARDFRKLLTVSHPDIEDPVLPIKDFNPAMGLYQVTVDDGKGARDRWITRSSVDVWPPPFICESSLQGSASQPEQQVSTGVAETIVECPKNDQRGAQP